MKPKVYPRRNVPGPNVLEAEDSLEEEAAQEAEGVEEDSSSSDLPDTRAPQAAVKVKEDEEPAGGAQAESTRGRIPRAWPIGGQQREGVPRAVRSSSESAEAPVEDTGGGGNRDGEARKDHQA